MGLKSRWLSVLMTARVAKRRRHSGPVKLGLAMGRGAGKHGPALGDGDGDGVACQFLGVNESRPESRGATRAGLETPLVRA